MTTTVAAQSVNAGSEVLAWLRGAITVLFVVALPLLLISTNVRLLFTDRDFILQGFYDNQVELTTGLDRAQLAQVATGLVHYFQAPPGPFNQQVTVAGQPRPLFNQKEVDHMVDVQALVQAFFRIQIIAAVIVLARVVLALAGERSAHWLGRDMLLSAALAVGVVLVVGVAAAVDFDRLWTAFHHVAFRNDFWLLDPRTDYLIKLFPEPFWFTATFRLATAMTVGTVLVAVAGFAAWRWSVPR